MAPVRRPSFCTYLAAENFCKTKCDINVCTQHTSISKNKNELNNISEFRTNATWAENSQEIINDGKAFGILLSLYTTIQFVAGIFAVDCFNRAAIRQITRIRIKYFESLMRQEIGWYDVFGSKNNVAVRSTE